MKIEYEICNTDCGSTPTFKNNVNLNTIISWIKVDGAWYKLKDRSWVNAKHKIDEFVMKNIAQVEDK